MSEAASAAHGRTPVAAFAARANQARGFGAARKEG
jgi:hypothetical protein